MNTPTTPTALNALKQAVLRADILIQDVQDRLNQSRTRPEFPGIEIEIEILDSARVELWKALGSVLPGVTWDSERETSSVTKEAWEALRTYDDGTPVFVVVEISHGRPVDYFPRLDGDLGEFIRLFRDDEIVRSIAEGRATSK